jgi:hypothetical protein
MYIESKEWALHNRLFVLAFVTSAFSDPFLLRDLHSEYCLLMSCALRNVLIYVWRDLLNEKYKHKMSADFDNPMPDLSTSGYFF